METFSLSLVLTLFLFFLNGILVFRLFQIKDWVFSRVLADYYSLKGKSLILNKRDLAILILGGLFLLSRLLGGEIFLNLFSLFDFFFLNLILEIASLISVFSLSLAEFFLTNYLSLGLFSLTLVLFFFRLKILKTLKFTPKALLLFFLFLLINFSFLYFSQNDILLIFFLSLSYFQIFLFSLALIIFEILVKPYLFFLRQKVKNKLKELKLKKIIIVGSYGKSSTKEFLLALLKEKKVFSLPSRINHEYVVLKYLLKNDLSNFDYLLLELGSYYLGNVAWITKAIIPDYVFITGIAKQHYFLFGEKISNVIRAEGTEALKWMREGKVFVNSNHEYFSDLQKELAKEVRTKNLKIITYGKNGDYTYEILEISEEKSIFKLRFDNEEHLLETNLIYPPQIENLVGAISFVLEERILSLTEISEKIKNIVLPPTFLKPIKLANFVIFNDSYNANPRGVVEGLKYFQGLNYKKKIVIFNGLLELGRETKNFYKELANIFQNFDLIILTNPEEFKFFKKIIPQKIFFPKNQEELDKAIKQFKEVTAIFIFNRFPRGLKLNLDEEAS